MQTVNKNPTKWIKHWHSFIVLFKALKKILYFIYHIHCKWRWQKQKWAKHPFCLILVGFIPFFFIYLSIFFWEKHEVVYSMASCFSQEQIIDQMYTYLYVYVYTWLIERVKSFKYTTVKLKLSCLPSYTHIYIYKCNYHYFHTRNISLTFGWLWAYSCHVFDYGCTQL